MANQQQGRGNQRRRSAQKRRGPVDIWRSSPPLPDLEPVVVAHDMTALIRSLGEPPMNGVSNAAVHLATMVNGVVTRRFDADTGARPGRLVRSS